MSAHQVVEDERLMKTLAEQLKLSLLQIARLSEIQMTSEDRATIAQMAQTALRLVDSYLLSTDVHLQQSLLPEPTSINSILYEAAEEVREHSQLYGCDVEVQLTGRLRPIFGNAELLRAAFAALATALIEMQKPVGQSTARRIVLAAHRHGENIVAGVFTEQSGLTTDMFRRARALYGSSRQPLVNSLPSAAAGVFLADSLFTSVASPLKIAHHNKLSGLATNLLPSQQLRLV